MNGILQRRSLVFLAALALIGAGAFWATSSMAAGPQRHMLPNKASDVPVQCDQPVFEEEGHNVNIPDIGSFQEGPASEPTRILVDVESPFIAKSGLKTVPLRLISIGAKGFAEGIGETRFWLDPTRPVQSAIWEKRAGTEFPAIQEMRFHFFYTLEAMPGKVYRSINPARMRSDNVLSFPPSPGTVYRLAEPVQLEDISRPGVVAGTVLTNRAVVRRQMPGWERPVQ